LEPRKSRPLRAILAAVVTIFFVTRLSAHAEDASPSPASDKGERVVLADSYIPTAETESAQRVLVYTAEILQKQGANTPIEGLRQLPIFVGTTATENDSNGGDGRAFINFFALGPNNVVTLIHGRRAFSFSDINAIPIAALSRTEILNGGVVYGSDSAGGVVNFILLNGPGEKPYEGAELHALYGNTTDKDAHVRQVYVRGGVTGLDGKVSIAAAGEYYSRANLYARDRPDVARSADTSNSIGDPNYPGSVGMQWGGLNNNSPTFSGRISVATSIGLGPNGLPLTGNLVLVDPNTNDPGSPGAYRGFDRNNADNSILTGSDPSRFNFRAFTPAIPAMEKAMYYVTGRFKIFGDGLQLYGDVMYSHVKQDNGQAGSPFLMSSAAGVGTAGISEMRASNFNPFGNNLTSVRYRLQQELGNRRSFFDRDYWRYEAGINGDFDIKDNGFISRFGYDSGLVYEHLQEQRTDSGDARRTYLRALIAPPGFANAAAPLPFTPLAGSFNPFIGQFAPITGTAPIYNNTNSAAPNFRNGVPVGIGAYDNTLAALGWTAGGASYIGHSLFFERDFLYDARANVHLFPNLWNGGFDFALGYEHREIQPHSIPDPVQASADPVGFNQQSLFKHRQEVDSWFLEMGVPLITPTMNLPWVRSLDLTIGWRREDFSDTNLLPIATSPFRRSASFVNENPDENFGGSPSVSLRYQPNPDLMFRASWQQSIRPPTFDELFTPVTQIFPQLFGIGIGPPQFPAGVLSGGNPALNPETTDSYSAGVVWSPKFVPGFMLTVDAYQMFTTNLIVDPANFAQVLLARNQLAPIQTDPNGDPFCETNIDPATNIGIVRNALGDLQCIFSPFGNAGKRHVQGVEVTASYELPTEIWGWFTFSGGYNHFFTWKAQPGVGPYRSFLGNYDTRTLPLAPGAIPWNKGYLRGEWAWRHFDFVATGNYIGDFRDDQNFNAPANPVIGQPDYTGRIRTIPSYITLDLQLSYEFVKPEAELPSYSKEAKESKMRTAPEASSIWQRLFSGTTLTAGVNNAFDRNPPSVLAAFNDNYDTSLYSIRNRYYYVALSKKF
jgi:iron complex outermembrane receptor protein